MPLPHYTRRFPHYVLEEDKYVNEKRKLILEKILNDENIDFDYLEDMKKDFMKRVDLFY